MTELLYLPTSAAAYETRFRAEVVALPPGAVVLDRTLFYPTGGGQPCDLGRLERADGVSGEVVDVTKSGSSVVHRLARRSDGRTPLRVGESVTGTIDWARRHRHMRLHTFQHLLSARVFARTGRRTERATFSGAGGVIDVEGPWPPDATADLLATDLLEYLAPPRAVHVRLVPRAEYELDPGSRSGLVPLPPQVDPVRVIEIDGTDRCPCGGTHLRSTGEVGRFELLPPVARAGGAIRLSFRLPEDAPPTPGG